LWVTKAIENGWDGPEEKIELLWDVWRNYSSTGYKVLDSHIGAIYGDSITMTEQKKNF
jgi:nicotinamide phosphoribosyltransferase